MGTLGRVIREPVLHFALLGAGVFGLAQLAEDEADTAIIVDQATVQRLASELETSLGRAPTEQEREQAVSRFADAERLFREGLALGLDRGDPVVRRRVLQKMEFVGANVELPQDPSDDVLQEFMAEQAPRYAGEPRFDFVLVTVPRRADDTDDTRARAVLEQLTAGADPRGVDGRHASGKRFSLANTARTYGEHVAEALDGLRVGDWKMVAFDRGWSLLRLNALQPGQQPTFAAIRSRVLRDWNAAQRASATEQRLVELRKRYPVRRVP